MNKLNQKILNKFGPWIAFSLLMIVFFGAANAQYIKEVEVNKRSLQDKVNVVAAKVEGELSSYIYYAYATKSILSVYPDKNLKLLDSFFSSFDSLNDESFKSFTVIKDTKIVYSYPREDNSLAIGTNLSLLPDQKEAIDEVKTRGVPAISAPVDLIQGGKAIILRIPIDAFMDDNLKKTYWGQTSVVLDFEKVFEKPDIVKLGLVNNIRIIGTAIDNNGSKTIWQNTQEGIIQPISTDINILDVKWKMNVEPKSGWWMMSNTVLAIFIGGLFISTLAFIFLRYLFKFNEELNQKVLDRTRLLEESLDKLKETQEMLIEERKNAAFKQE